MSVTYPLDLNTDVGKVRLLIPDRDPSWFAFQDEELTAFLALEGSRVKRAAALALETIAADVAMVDKVQETLDLKTDGAKTAEALMQRAAQLREQDDQETDTAFGLVAWGDLNPFNAEEYYDRKGEWADGYFSNPNT
ncbi:MAG: hypothetical protein KDE45_05580 [Caldilineaceae bacterium]|nr:hypothetical protein [Caldilineaceae bacterium]